MNNNQVTIIDYGLGNIQAFINIYQALDIDVKIAKSEEDLVNTKRLILPGVGSFDWAMQRLNSSGMRKTIDELVLVNKIPILGICVGMQMMAINSEEGKMNGLGWFNAHVKKFNFDKINANHRLRLPHMGWNFVESKFPHSIFEGLNHPRFYFLHTFYFHTESEDLNYGISNYGFSFPSVVIKNNIIGVQFHPEKSHEWGMQLLKNFAQW
jgi:glutamine amidotransferase